MEGIISLRKERLPLIHTDTELFRRGKYLIEKQTDQKQDADLHRSGRKREAETPKEDRKESRKIFKLLTKGADQERGKTTSLRYPPY